MIPVVSWRQLVPHDLPIVTLERGNRIDGNVSDFELDIINRLVAYNRPKTVFEIGTFDGRTTLNMAANSSFEALVYSLDLPSAQIGNDTPTTGARFLGSPFAPKVTQLFGDSGTFDFTPYAGKMDFIFVDGSASYEYILSDSIKALSMASKECLILWHDYVPRGPTPWPGLTQALNELHSGDPRFKSMKHIAGTAMVVLKIPALSLLHVEDCHVVDSTQPELLSAEIEVELRERTEQEIFIRGRTRNSGRATWLPSGAPEGPVRLGVRLLASNGEWISDNYSRVQIVTRPIRPGEQLEFEGTVPAPPDGRHILEFDLVAEGVAWFSRNGSQCARLSLGETA